MVSERPGNSHQLPQSIKVGATLYTMTNQVEHWREHLANGEVTNDAWAQTDHFISRVFIKPGQSLSQEQQTVIHEVMHTIAFNAINWDAMASIGTESDKEEYMVNIMAPFMLEILRDNTDLYDYLMQRPYFTGMHDG